MGDLELEILVGKYFLEEFFWHILGGEGGDGGVIFFDFVGKVWAGEAGVGMIFCEIFFDYFVGCLVLGIEAFGAVYDGDVFLCL